MPRPCGGVSFWPRLGDEIVFPHSEEGVTVLWTEWAALSLLAISVIGLALAWRWERLGGWMIKNLRFLIREFWIKDSKTP